WRDMMVLADRTAIVEAELENGHIIDGHLQRIAHPLVVVGLLLDVAAVDDGRGGLDVRTHQSGFVHDRHIRADGLESAVGLLRLEGADPCRNVGPVVDKLDAVEVDVASPPFSVGSPLEGGLLADLVGNQLEWPGADRMLDEILPRLVEAAMDD